MSDIVYTHTVKERQYVDQLNSIDFANRTACDRKVTIFQAKDKVALVHGTLVCGVPRGYPDKRWYKWRSTASYGLRRNSNGTLVPWNCSRPWDFTKETQWKHHTATAVFDKMEDTGDEADAFRKAIRESFGVTDWTSIYPIVNQYGIYSYKHVPFDLRGAFRAGTMQEFVAKSFGIKRTNATMVEAVSNTDPWIVDLAYQFRGLVPDADLTNFLVNNHFDDEMMEFKPFSPLIRKVAKQLSEPVRRTLLSKTLDYSDMGYIFHVNTYKNTIGWQNGGDKVTSWERLAKEGRSW